MTEFNPQIILTTEEKVNLSIVAVQPGYGVIHKILRSCVDALAVDLLNTDAAEADKVLARHRSAQVAAQLFEMLTNRINNEVYLAGAPKADPVEDPLDLGEVDTEYDYGNTGFDSMDEEPF